MPNCPHCGQEIETGSGFCHACGQSVIVQEEASAPVSVPEQIQIGEVKAGDYFKAGWELFKKYPAGFIGFFIITMAVSIVAQMVPVIGVLIGIVLVSPLNAGFFVVGAKLLQNQAPQFADFF